MNSKYSTLTDTELANIVGGKIISYPYGVHYNTKTGKAQIDPAGFAHTWDNNVIGNLWKGNRH
ncbi:MAG: bacteriocin [Vagococcus fluvialis]